MQLMVKYVFCWLPFRLKNQNAWLSMIPRYTDIFNNDTLTLLFWNKPIFIFKINICVAFAHDNSEISQKRIKSKQFPIFIFRQM